MSNDPTPDDATWRPTNRDKTLTPRSRSSWCRCDKAVIHDGEDCPACGRTHPRRRLKLNPRNARLT